MTDRPEFGAPIKNRVGPWAFKAAVRALIENPEIALRELARWERCARPKQRAPEGDWRIWLIHTGRGWGKTRTAAEWFKLLARSGVKRMLAIGPTMTDVHDIMVPMLLKVFGDDEGVTYRRSQDRPRVTVGDVEIHLRSGQKVDRVRGLEVGAVWCDEIDHWKPEAYRSLHDAWRAAVEPTCRMAPARFVVTSTPVRRGMISKLREMPGVHVTTGHTRENAANLADNFLDDMEASYEGSSWLKRQELGGEVLDQIEGAIVSQQMIDAARVIEAPVLRRIVVGVDPSGGTEAQGIVVAGVDERKHLYVLADYTCTMTPDGWGQRVIDASNEFDAERIIAERNFGGDMVVSTIKTVDPEARVRVVTASRGKAVRFEPLGALYEQGRVHHVGPFDPLEDEVTAFTLDEYEGMGSPNRADALVWAAHELVLARHGPSPKDLYGGRREAKENRIAGA